MITIQNAIEKIVQNDIEARTALERGYMNYSKYARLIQKEVENLSKKKVSKESIVITLSRMKKAKATKKLSDIPHEILIKNIITRSPVTELSYEKNAKNLTKLKNFFAEISHSSENFLTITYSSSDITIACSDILVPQVEKRFAQKALFKQSGLAALGLTINQELRLLPGITYSLLQKIAAHNITLAETITTYTEIIFTFEKQHLGEMIELFS